MKPANGRMAAAAAGGLAIALLIALFSPFASTEPDGLERVAEDEAFAGKAKDAPYEVIADYVFPWVGNEDVATVLAGVTGVAIVAALVLAIGLGLQRWSSRPRSAPGRPAGSSSDPPS